ncbi:hypothetical protein ENSA7_17990 [Enhygromyxa salina]|uniref:Cytochrome c domain-containing protein n=2 Tax=Enhygromyxa salina TaxID=215803 RepID=A0A2S9YTU7_9BACT|nr:hypothetical protein ENSA7_17990 [Enhygromyxa salina]
MPADTGDTQAETSGDGDGDGDGDGEALRPNWHEDIAPLVYGTCVGCHYDGGIAPFALETYEQAAPWAGLMSEAVNDGVMPPWGALETEECQPDHTWLDDVRLSDAQRQLLADWVTAGTPEGDPDAAVPLPEPPSLELADTTVVLQNPSPYTVGGTSDSFVCMVVDPGNETDVWVTGVQIIADNAEVVHHVLTYIDSESASDDLVDADGKFSCPGGFVSLNGTSQISTWVPGGVPTETPPDVGFPMPVGSKIIMAYHYHPTGAGDEIDQSAVALRWTEEAPALTGYMGVLGAIFSSNGVDPGPNDPDGVPVFQIPPNVSNHVETVTYKVPDLLPPVDVFTIGTHMHYVGVDMKIWIERGGQELCWLQTPRWDFNWQRLYDVDAPIGQMPKVQGGDVIKLRCTYDNTLNNPALVEALAQQGLSEPITINVGESSLEEMCAMLFGVATDLPLGSFF